MSNRPKAGDFSCPDCGTGFGDIAPSFEFGPDPDGVVSLASEEIIGHCKNGHQMSVRRSGADSFVVTSVAT